MRNLSQSLTANMDTVHDRIRKSLILKKYPVNVDRVGRAKARLPPYYHSVPQLGEIETIL
jgi:hypothetical protein